MKQLSIIICMLLASFILISIAAIAPIHALESNLETPCELDMKSTGAEIISHDAFSVLSPVPDGEYYVNEAIEIQIGIKKYYPPESKSSYNPQANVVMVEIYVDDMKAYGFWFFIDEDDIGKTFSSSFTRSIEGECTVRVGFSKTFETEVTDENFVGSYTINVKPNASSNQYFKMLNPTVHGEYPVNEELEVKIKIQKFVFKYYGGVLLPNIIELDFEKDGQIVHTMNIKYDSSAGIITLKGFTPTEPGEYTLSAIHFAGIGAGTDLGSYTFTVKSVATDISGDADGDGMVTAVDTTWMQRLLAHQDVPDAFNEAAADVDGDGMVTSMDITWIQRYLAKMETPYAIGEEKG